MSDDKRDPPIDERDFLSGVRVVNIGDYRVSRGMTRRAFSGCHHRNVTYDDKERRIWCRDCERDVEPFDAFITLVEYHNDAANKLLKRQNELREAEQFQIRSLATKALDHVWRKRDMVPACPHCGMGLFPEDFKSGVKTRLGRDYAKAMLMKRKGVEP